MERACFRDMARNIRNIFYTNYLVCASYRSIQLFCGKEEEPKLIFRINFRVFFNDVDLKDVIDGLERFIELFELFNRQGLEFLRDLLVEGMRSSFQQFGALGGEGDEAHALIVQPGQLSNHALFFQPGDDTGNGAGIEFEEILDSLVRRLIVLLFSKKT